MNTNITTPTSRSTEKTFAFVGGVAGLIGFLFVGLLPAMVYVGYAGVTLASALFGTPIDATLAARSVVLFGMVVGLLATASLFAVVGAALGAGAHAMADKVAPARASN